MSGLEIQPHSRRVSGLVVAALAVLAAGSFAAGLIHQFKPAGPSPFPAPQEPTLAAAGPAPRATPAPVVRLATRASTPRIAAAALPPAASPDDQPAAAPAAADTPTAADVSATVPAPAAAPQPTPDPQPSSPDLPPT